MKLPKNIHKQIICISIKFLALLAEVAEYTNCISGQRLFYSFLVIKFNFNSLQNKLIKS